MEIFVSKVRLLDSAVSLTPQSSKINPQINNFLKFDVCSFDKRTCIISVLQLKQSNFKKLVIYG